MDNQLELIARAIIIQGDTILLCKTKGGKHYFLPGGHVEFQENAQSALIREIQEELNATLKNISFVGAGENFYTKHGVNVHELNLVFKGKIDTKLVKSAEDHLSFFWQKMNELPRTLLWPDNLKLSLLQWIKTGKPFWASAVL